ncbi:transposase [Streptomyces sp. NPDC058737]|uniref:IS110 family transposase n=1 Tax=Streptomyces sp. NPDC058737 TaxID=3346617 RepID=UPI0036BA9DBF
MDTHGEVHVAAVISPLGKILGTGSFPATAAGYRQLLVWARKRGTVRRAGVEGTGTFGAGLSRYLLAQHVQVFEVNRPGRAARRLLGKSDPLDAQAAARAVLSGRARARAKSGDGPVHSARIFQLAKDSAVKARTQAINQLKAVLVIADPAGTAVQPGQCRAVPHLRAPRPTRWWGRRGRGGTGHPRDAAHARRTHRTAHRTDQ